MAKLRWGTEAPADRESARERLIETAEACFRQYGVSRTTIEDVAAAAEVSRATVYRYFDGRDDLIVAVLLREQERFLGSLQTHIRDEPDLSRAIVAVVMFIEEAIRTDKHLALLFTLSRSIPGGSEAAFNRSVEFLRPLFEAARERGELRSDVEPGEAAEWTLRVVLSLLAVPAQRNEDEQLRFLRTLFLPALIAPDQRPPSLGNSTHAPSPGTATSETTGPASASLSGRSPSSGTRMLCSPNSP